MHFFLIIEAFAEHLDVLVACPAACLHFIENIMLWISIVCDDRPDFHPIIILIPETLIRRKDTLTQVRSLELDFINSFLGNIELMVEHFISCWTIQAFVED